MKTSKILPLYFLLFFFLQNISFSKPVTILFNFDTPTGKIYYSNKSKPIYFKNFKAFLTLEKGFYKFTFSNKNQNKITKNIPLFEAKEYFINFSNSSTKKETSNLKIKKSESKFYGKIFDSNFKPISNSKIEIFNNNKKTFLTSNSFGEFESPLTKGLTFINISKAGYYSKNVIRNLSNNNNNFFILSKYSISFSGTIVDDVYPLENFPFYLFSENGILVDKGITDENGNFLISKIPINSFYFFIPETKKYKSYKSNLIKTNKSVNSFKITLSKH